jgi:hypothetical protein
MRQSKFTIAFGFLAVGGLSLEFLFHFFSDSYMQWATAERFG